jgi:hypothetical protein
MFNEAFKDLKSSYLELESKRGKINAQFCINHKLTVLDYDKLPIEYILANSEALDKYVGKVNEYANIFAFLSEADQKNEAKLARFNISSLRRYVDTSVFLDLVSAMPPYLFDAFKTSLVSTDKRHLYDMIQQNVVVENRPLTVNQCPCNREAQNYMLLFLIKGLNKSEKLKLPNTDDYKKFVADTLANLNPWVQTKFLQHFIELKKIPLHFRNLTNMSYVGILAQYQTEVSRMNKDEVKIETNSIIKMFSDYILSQQDFYVFVDLLISVNYSVQDVFIESLDAEPSLRLWLLFMRMETDDSDWVPTNVPRAEEVFAFARFYMSTVHEKDGSSGKPVH